MLWRALRDVTGGFYIDVGAADPSSLSVTRIFYEHGWRGINLEPNAGYFAELSRARPRDINLPIGAGRTAGQSLFHDVGGSGLSTFDPAIAAQHQAQGWAVRQQTIEMLTLAEICARHRPEGPIHFLKIDVEGGEADVLAGADFTRFRPWIVLVEATLPGSQVENFVGWEPMLTSQGYGFVWFDGLNRFYLAAEMQAPLARHFRLPPNIFDGFETAASLLARAEGLEQELIRVRAEAALQVRQTAEAHRRIAESLQQSAAALTHQARLTGEAQQRSAASFAELARMTHRAELAEARISWMLASTSWRLTAPVRALRGLRASGTGRVPLAGARALARRVAHAGLRRLRRAPGGRMAGRVLRRVAPRATAWLVRRYLAYEQLAAVAQARAAVTAGAASPSDLSEAEARLYRQLARATAPEAQAA